MYLNNQDKAVNLEGLWKEKAHLFRIDMRSIPTLIQLGVPPVCKLKCTHTQTLRFPQHSRARTHHAFLSAPVASAQNKAVFQSIIQLHMAETHWLTVRAELIDKEAKKEVRWSEREQSVACEMWNAGDRTHQQNKQRQAMVSYQADFRLVYLYPQGQEKHSTCLVCV